MNSPSNRSQRDESGEAVLEWLAALVCAGWLLMLVCGNLHQHWSQVPPISFLEATVATGLLALVAVLVFTSKKMVETKPPKGE